MIEMIHLPHQLDRSAMTCRAVIETPRGARSKYDWDPDTSLFRLAGLLPEGMSFPMNFGFFPSTKAADGDPLDVLVLHDEPMSTGAWAWVRLIGVIEADQTQDGSTVRNDRLVSVTTCSRVYERIGELAQMGDTYIEQLTQFWVNYNALRGSSFDLRGIYGPRRAADALQAATC